MVSGPLGPVRGFTVSRQEAIHRCRSVLVGADLSYRSNVILSRIGSKLRAAAELGVSASTLEDALVPYGRMTASTHANFVEALSRAEARLSAREAS